MLRILSSPQTETGTYRIERYQNTAHNMPILYSFNCKICEKESFNQDDVKHRYCSICDFFHGMSIVQEYVDSLEDGSCFKELYQKVIVMRKAWLEKMNSTPATQ